MPRELTVQEKVSAIQARLELAKYRGRPVGLPEGWSDIEYLLGVVEQQSREFDENELLGLLTAFADERDRWIREARLVESNYYALVDKIRAVLDGGE